MLLNAPAVLNLQPIPRMMHQADPKGSICYAQIIGPVAAQETLIMFIQARKGCIQTHDLKNCVVNGEGLQPVQFLSDRFT